MAKYIEHDGQGGLKEAIPITSSSGAGDANKIIQTDNTGKIDETLLPPGIGADTASVEASEDLAAGDLVNIWDDSGTAKCRKADASVFGKEANGFVLTSVTTGNNAVIYFEGTNNQLSGMTPGKTQFLSTTPGQVTETPPIGVGNVVQIVGKSFSATEMNFESNITIILA